MDEQTSRPAASSQLINQSIV